MNRRKSIFYKYHINTTDWDLEYVVRVLGNDVKELFAEACKSPLCSRRRRAFLNKHIIHTYTQITNKTLDFTGCLQVHTILRNSGLAPCCLSLYILFCSTSCMESFNLFYHYVLTIGALLFNLLKVTKYYDLYILVLIVRRKTKNNPFEQT